MKPYLPGQQKLNYNCGPTCIANALALYGLPTSQEACQGASGCGVDGTSERMLAQGIRKFGFYPIVRHVLKADKNIKRKELRQLEWVKRETDKGRFVIVGINGNGKEGHWILVLKIQRGGIIIWDPSEKLPTRVGRRNFFKAWRNSAPPIHGHLDAEDDHVLIHGISMSPRSALARRAVEIRYYLMNPKLTPLSTEK